MSRIELLHHSLPKKQELYYLYYTSIWASLLRRIVDGASAKAVKVCARFSVGIVSDRELFVFSGHLETKEGTGMP